MAGSDFSGLPRRRGAIEHWLSVFVERRFVDPTVNAWLSVLHLNDYRERRGPPGFAAFPCVHQLPALLMQLGSFLLLIETACPAFPHLANPCLDPGR